MTDNTIKMPTIGILGVTIPGAIDFLSKLHKNFHGAFSGHHHPHIILHQLDFSPTHNAQNAGEWQTVEDRLVESAQVLVKAGADFVAIPANTVHIVIEGVSRRTSIPVLNMIELVANECQAQGLKKVGIMGTLKWAEGSISYKSR
jgi:aspartate racemase